MHRNHSASSWATRRAWASMIGLRMGSTSGHTGGADAGGVSTMLGSVVTGTPSAFVALAAEPSSSSTSSSSFCTAGSVRSICCSWR